MPGTPKAMYSCPGVTGSSSKMGIPQDVNDAGEAEGNTYPGGNLLDLLWQHWRGSGIAEYG